ncbi:MAG: WG repeat-containing protein [[Eubacterium] siraeum]
MLFNGKYDKVDNENVFYYFNGYLPVCKGGKWGFIGYQRKRVVKCRFEDITSVYDGKAWAKENGKWGVIKL